METQDLIRAIAADAGRSGMPMRKAWWAAVALATVAAAISFFALLGPRPDILHALETARFPFKFVVTVTLAASAFSVLTAIVSPRRRRRKGWLEPSCRASSARHGDDCRTRPATFHAMGRAAHRLQQPSLPSLYSPDRSRSAYGIFARGPARRDDATGLRRSGGGAPCWRPRSDVLCCPLPRRFAALCRHVVHVGDRWIGSGRRLNSATPQPLVKAAQQGSKKFIKVSLSRAPVTKLCGAPVGPVCSLSQASSYGLLPCTPASLATLFALAIRTPILRTRARPAAPAAPARTPLSRTKPTECHLRQHRHEFRIVDHPREEALVAELRLFLVLDVIIPGKPEKWSHAWLLADEPASCAALILFCAGEQQFQRFSPIVRARPEKLSDRQAKVTALWSGLAVSAALSTANGPLSAPLARATVYSIQCDQRAEAGQGRACGRGYLDRSRNRGLADARRGFAGDGQHAEGPRLTATIPEMQPKMDATLAALRKEEDLRGESQARAARIAQCGHVVAIVKAFLAAKWPLENDYEEELPRCITELAAMPEAGSCWPKQGRCCPR